MGCGWKISERWSSDTIIGNRNRALLVIGWAAALRRLELVSLDVEHVENQGVLLNLVRSKNAQKKAKRKKWQFHMVATYLPVQSISERLDQSSLTFESSSGSKN
jgi:site-specific recombinase XerC